MNYLTSTEYLDKEHDGPACHSCNFAGMLYKHLGEPSWRRLDRAIRARFAGMLSERNSLQFKGQMQWVYCSPVAYLIAKFIKPFSILPDVCARDADFTFTIKMQDGVIRKQRCYTLGGSADFVFTSRFSDTPQLHEEFGGGIGMFLQLYEKRKALLFRDRGYFIRFGGWRIPLSRWLSVGQFDLLHRNLDDHRFQIIIRVAHPLFGTLFYQRGEFSTV